MLHGPHLSCPLYLVLNLVGLFIFLWQQIIQARDLPARDLRRNTTSSYVRVYALPTRRHNHRTNVIEKSLNPTFNELFIISGLTLMEVQQLMLQFLVIHNEAVSRNVVIGEAMLSALGQFDLTGDEVVIWKDIKPYQFQNVRQIRFCSINFIFTY